jgi:conjugal transfer pilus assembly protein TraD
MSSKKRFESILRPLYEARAVAAWIIAAIWCLVWGLVVDFRSGTIFMLVAMSVAIACWRAFGGYQLAKQKLALIGKPISFLTTERLTKALPEMGDNLWLGWGYRWEPRHTQRAYEVMKHDLAEVYPPQWMLKLMGETRKPAEERGMQWIHGLEPVESDIKVPFDALKGHCAVIATTGSLKTRLVALFAYQLAARGDTIVCIDPKGDVELREILRSCAVKTGKPERF